MKKIFAFFLLLIMCLGLIGVTGCEKKKKTVRETSQTLMVCSGAGLMKPMNELIKQFEQKTGAKIQVHYGGSAEIFGILQTTCGCDVFIPGAYKYTRDTLKRGYLVKNTIKKVTLHIPIIVVPSNNLGHIQALEDLARPGVEVVLGDPKACAIGKVSKKILETNGLWQKVKGNVLTFTPTVNQLLIYIVTGQADAAIVWEDMTSWAQAKGKIKVVPIPSKQNLIKTIPTAVTICAKKHGVFDLAKSFNDFILTPQSLSVWKKWGFKPCR